MKKSIFLFLCLLLSLTLTAQNKKVSGTVTDSNGEPLIGATILEVGTQNAATTDIDGNFSIQVKPDGQISISYIGFETQVFNAAERELFMVMLKPDSESLDEIVITAYGGTQLRSKLTNSIAKVKEETFSTGIYSNPAQALSGAVAGLRVQQTSGNPGATPTVVLRGGTDLNGGGSPLVIVDGQIRSMNDMNPNDIESMEVMKDAGATAIYGARANNGVILITTKKGKSGQTQISASAKVSLNYFNNGNYRFLGAEDYLTYMRTAYWTSSHLWQNSKGVWQGVTNMSSLTGAQPYGTGNKYFDANGNVLNGNKNNQAVWSPMKYTDDLAFLLNQGWKKMRDPLAAFDPAYDQDIIFKEFMLSDVNLRTPSTSQDYNLSFSGGNDRGHYYSGLGFNYSNGNAITNWYQRLTFVFNGDYKIKDWLTSYSSLNFADAKWNGLPATATSEEQYFSRIFSVPPTFRGETEDGEMLIGVRGEQDANQAINADKFIRDYNTDKFTLGQSFKIDFTRNLYLKLNATWYYSDNKQEAFNKDYMTNVNRTNTTRSSSAYYDRTLDQTYNAILNYDLSIKEKHNINAMAGFEFYDTYNKGFNASGRGAPTDDFMDLGYTVTDEGARSIDSWHSRQRIMSLFARVNYDYDGKYLFSFSIRDDGYSKLAKENRFGVFPGVSAGWIMSREDFMESVSDVISFAKIRASYGLNGNVSGLGAYTVQGAYGSNQYAGSKGFLLSTLPNPGLLWEKSRTMEAGFDVSFVNNKYNLNFTYYDRLTKDKFASITLPSHSGISSYTSNNGSLRNRGIEIEANLRLVDSKDWKWNLNFNAAYNINKIVSLPDNGLENNRQGAYQVYGPDGNLIWVGGYQEGQRPGDVYAFQYEGIYKSNDEIPANLIDKSTGNNGSNNKVLYGSGAWNALTDSEKSKALPIQPGDVKWKDVNGDGVIDNFDQVKVGNTTPTWTGGLTTTVSWKGLSLYIRTDYALGHVINDTKTPWIMGNMQGTYNTIDLVKQAWSESNPSGQYPIYVWADQLGKRNYARQTSQFIYKADYLAIREVSLSYQLPNCLIEKLRMTNLELSVSGQNLGYITKAKNVFSPEYGASGWGGYSLPRTIVFGLKVNF